MIRAIPLEVAAAAAHPARAVTATTAAAAAHAACHAMVPAHVRAMCRNMPWLAASVAGAHVAATAAHVAVPAAVVTITLACKAQVRAAAAAVGVAGAVACKVAGGAADVARATGPATAAAAAAIVAQVGGPSAGLAACAAEVASLPADVACLVPVRAFLAHMAWLTAAVARRPTHAHAAARAVCSNVTRLTTVVADAHISAAAASHTLRHWTIARDVTWHAASVAAVAPAAATHAAAETIAVIAHGAVARDVPHTVALVASHPAAAPAAAKAAAHATTTTTAAARAVARQVPWHAAVVACGTAATAAWCIGALTRNVPFLPTLVACATATNASVRAVLRHVARLLAVVAGLGICRLGAVLGKVISAAAIVARIVRGAIRPATRRRSVRALRCCVTCMQPDAIRWQASKARAMHQAADTNSLLESCPGRTDDGVYCISGFARQQRVSSGTDMFQQQHTLPSTSGAAMPVWRP